MYIKVKKELIEQKNPKYSTFFAEFQVETGIFAKKV